MANAQMASTNAASTGQTADPHLVALTTDWVTVVGPALLRISRTRDLTRYEKRMLEAVKIACPCHRTDNPRQEYASNGEDCDICGRKM